MIGSEFKRYERYKDSGVEWLGEVPEGWEVTHLKRFCKNITDGAHTSPDLSANDFPFVTVVNLESGILDFENCLYTSKQDYHYLVRNGCQPQKHDVLYSKDGTISKTAVIHEDKAFVVGSSFIIIKPILRRVESIYLSYLLSSSIMCYQARIYVKGASLPRISIFNITKLIALFPPLLEQQAIAAYLDEKTNRIDRKIELLQAKADRYRELKQALINEAVTRGLDPTVPMKDSGVEWIGEVPAHWEVKRLKDIVRSSNGGAFKDDLADFGIPIIKIQQLTLNCEAVEFCDPDSRKINSNNTIKKGDLLFSWSTLIAPFLYQGEDALLNQHIFKLTLSNKIIKNWLFYKLIQSATKIKESAHGSTMQHILKSDFDNLEIEIPSITEQRNIATYLDIKTAQIEQIITTITTQIQTLQELRKTLINDVVTGKIKVV